MLHVFILCTYMPFYCLLWLFVLFTYFESVFPSWQFLLAFCYFLFQTVLYVVLFVLKHCLTNKLAKKEQGKRECRKHQATKKSLLFLSRNYRSAFAFWLNLMHRPFTGGRSCYLPFLSSNKPTFFDAFRYQAISWVMEIKKKKHLLIISEFVVWWERQ